MYYFKTRSLPAEVYQVVKTLKTQYGLTNWQGVILAVQCLVSLAHTNPSLFQEMLDKVKTDHPDSPAVPKV